MDISSITASLSFLGGNGGRRGGGGGAGIERREKDKGNEREKISLYIFWGKILSDFRQAPPPLSRLAS